MADAADNAIALILDKAKAALSPEEQALLDAALKQADSDGDGAPDVAGLKAFFFKNGKFSKTAAFATLGNLAVLVTYFLQSWLAGANVDLHVLKFVVPAFNMENALAILGVLNGTYLGNNFLKTKAP